MKLNIEELMREAEKDARDYYKARLNQPCGGATFDGDFLPERNRAFARLIVERCAVEAEKLSPHPDEYSDQSECTEKRVALGCASAIRKLLEAE